MTRRPPRRAPCLARHYQVTMRASVNVLAQANLDRNFPSGMGDRRVGTGMPCEVSRLVDQDCLRQSSLTVTRKGSSMHSISTTRVPLESFLPPSRRDGKAS